MVTSGSTEASKCKIVLVDDHPIVREGLRVLLEQLNYVVIGQASDGLEAIKLVEELRPNILMVDLMMGKMNGLEVTRRVSKQYPETSVIILSMYKDESYVIEALRAGAKAYVLKESYSEDLTRAINEVLSGKRYLGSSISERAIEAYSEKTISEFQNPYETLSIREREVIQMVVHGMTSKQIAETLVISPRTVDIHRRNIMRKLALHSRDDLTRFAQRQGIIPAEVALIKK
jgi:DNA-binding NarL/FixJ family response regulator